MKRLLLTFGLLVMSGPAFAVDCVVNEYEFVRDPTAPVAPEPAIATQKVTFTTTSTQISALQSSTRFVRIICTAKAHFLFGTNPTADTDDAWVAADTPEYFGILGSNILVAFVQGS